MTVSAKEVEEVAVGGDAEVDRGVILEAAFGNRVIEVAKVSLNQIRMKATNADFDYGSLPNVINISPVPSTHQTRRVSPLFEPAEC
jgi:hypothetical protein